MNIIILLTTIFSLSTLAHTDSSLNLTENTQYVLGINHLKKWTKGGIKLLKDHNYDKVFCENEVFSIYKTREEIDREYTVEKQCEGVLMGGNYIVDKSECEDAVNNFRLDAFRCFDNK